MKNIKAYLKMVQGERHEIKAHLEPLQEQAENMIVELETEKGRLEHAHSESIKVLEENITIQEVETLT
jgi:hypothetical protein